jgi:hypothetical protein
MTSAPSRSPDLVNPDRPSSRRDREIIGRTILEAAPGRVLLVGGLGLLEAHACLDPVVVPDDGPMGLLLPLPRFSPADALIEDLADHLARVALQCWPVWYGDVDFSGLKRDTFGRNVVQAKLSTAALDWPRLSHNWARAAVALAQDRRVPRPARVHWSIEIIQLCLAIHPYGLVLVLDAKTLPAPDKAHALVHALELVADKAGIAVVVLSASLPDPGAPYDRILAEAVTVPAPAEKLEEDEVPIFGLVPVFGRPHPLNETEKRIARAIAAAPDLAPLFRCNEIVETSSGSRPRVDLVWPDGRLVVELDNYIDHARRDAFVEDRQRDYELLLSGYSVLRLADDEIRRNVDEAIDKIRDLVAYVSARRMRRA